MPETRLPVKNGTLEMNDASGHCVIDGCKIKGGGLLQLQHVTKDAEKVADLAWRGKRLVICGDHLLEILTAVLSLPEDG